MTAPPVAPPKSAERQWWERYLSHPTAVQRMFALYGQRYGDFFFHEFRDGGWTVEFGSGPVPVMETMECSSMLAVDIDEYEGLTRWPILTDPSEITGNHWDTALLLNVLDHADNPEELVGEAMRVLKPAGRCLVFVHVGNDMEDDDKHNCVELGEVKDWFADWVCEREDVRLTAGDPPAYLAVYRKPAVSPDKVLADAVDALNASGSIWTLACGSLLEAVRRGSFIPWEYDIDFAILEGDTQRITVEMNARGFKLWRNIDDNTLQFLREDTRLTIDCYFYQKDGEEIYQYVHVKDIPGRDDETLKYVYPADAWLTSIPIYWMGVLVNIPGSPEEILEMHYGEDWREPRKDWNWARDPLCLRPA